MSGDASQEPILQKTVHRVVKVKPSKKHKVICGPPNAFNAFIITMSLMVLINVLYGAGILVELTKALVRETYDTDVPGSGGLAVAVAIYAGITLLMVCIFSMISRILNWLPYSFAVESSSSS